VLGGIIYVPRAGVPWRLLPHCRQVLRRGGICPRIAPPRDRLLTRLGRQRWKVERSLAWLLANRRLTVRYERRVDILRAFPHLACALICAGKLNPIVKPRLPWSICCGWCPRWWSPGSSRMTRRR
jgi:transposase